MYALNPSHERSDPISCPAQDSSFEDDPVTDAYLKTLSADSNKVGSQLPPPAAVQSAQKQPLMGPPPPPYPS